MKRKSKQKVKKKPLQSKKEGLLNKEMYEAFGFGLPAMLEPRLAILNGGGLSKN